MSAALTRRALFNRLRGGQVQQRPPWSRGEQAFTDACTLCAKCIDICPTEILSKGIAGYPVVSFSAAHCTFCGKCADVCEADCFDRSGGRLPWSLAASITAACVEAKGVACRMCQEACERDAIRFRPKLGGGSIPSVDSLACTGCGACVTPCPVKAVSIAESNRIEVSA